jgi:hypothetical protein
MCGPGNGFFYPKNIENSLEITLPKELGLGSKKKLSGTGGAGFAGGEMILWIIFDELF